MHSLHSCARYHDGALHRFAFLSLTTTLSCSLASGLSLLSGIPGKWGIIGESPDGETALHMAVELKPSILVLDLSMPGLGGVEVTRELRT